MTTHYRRPTFSKVSVAICRWLRIAAQWLERRSLTGELSLASRSICSECVTTYVGITSAIGQPTIGKLSLFIIPRVDK